jgi:hypothetical protein
MTLDDALITKAAGIAGACISLAYMKGPLYMRLTNAVGGAIVSLYATPWAALKTGAPEGLAGFLLGLFGMAIIEATPVKEVWTSLLSKFGVK